MQLTRRLTNKPPVSGLVYTLTKTIKQNRLYRTHSVFKLTAVAFEASQVFHVRYNISLRKISTYWESNEMQDAANFMAIQHTKSKSYLQSANQSLQLSIFDEIYYLIRFYFLIQIFPGRAVQLPGKGVLGSIPGAGKGLLGFFRFFEHLSIIVRSLELYLVYDYKLILYYMELITQTLELILHLW